MVSKKLQQVKNVRTRTSEFIHIREIIDTVMEDIAEKIKSASQTKSMPDNINKRVSGE